MSSVSSSTKWSHLRVVWGNSWTCTWCQKWGQPWRLCSLKVFTYGSFVSTQSWHGNKGHIVNMPGCLKLEDPNQGNALSGKMAVLLLNITLVWDIVQFLSAKGSMILTLHWPRPLSIHLAFIYHQQHVHSFIPSLIQYTCMKYLLRAGSYTEHTQINSMRFLRLSDLLSNGSENHVHTRTYANTIQVYKSGVLFTYAKYLSSWRGESLSSQKEVWTGFWITNRQKGRNL